VKSLSTKPSIDFVHSAQTSFDWDFNSRSGQIDVFLSRDGQLIIDNGPLNRENVRKMLHSWADFIADRAILRDCAEDIPPVDLEAELERKMYGKL
jgi:hypothetical protein